MALDSVKKTYERLGREDPLYAVLSDKRFRKNRWDPVEFFKTGEREIAETLAWVERFGVEFGRERALDFGCGVGRLSQALADRFDEVLAVDISSTMLDSARKYNKKGDRIRFILNQSDDLRGIDGDSVDFIYTNITLQHIPPEHGVRYVAEFVRVLRPGGIALFKIPNGPEFEPHSLREKAYYLRRKLRRGWNHLRRRAPVEMHYIPRARVERVIRDAGARLLDVLDVDARRPGRRLGYCITK